MGYTVNRKLCSLVEEREREREPFDIIGSIFEDLLSMRLCLL